MIYTQEIKNMCPVAQGVHHGAAPCPTEGNWVQYKEIKDISGFRTQRRGDAECSCVPVGLRFAPYA